MAPECGPNIVKCFGRNKYRICFAGQLVGPIRHCPFKKVCDENSDDVCVVERQKSQIIRKSQQFIFYENDFGEDPIDLRILFNESPRYYRRSFNITPICGLERAYPYYAAGCSLFKRNSNHTLPGTGCRKFIFCCDRPEIFTCQKDYYFDGKICNNTFECPAPCTPISNFSIQESINKSGKAMYNSGLIRWPVEGASCKLYTELSYDSNGTHIGETKECPELSYFDPTEMRCRMRYLCEDTPNFATLCPVGIGHFYCDPEFLQPKCIDNRPVAVENSGCNYYVPCNGKDKSLVRCPFGYLFDPIKRNCSKDYVCENWCILYPTHGFPEKQLEYPKCDLNNRFLPIIGAECTQYVKCQWGKMVVAECPLRTWFDPNIQLCTIDYKCTEIPCVPHENLIQKYLTPNKTCDSKNSSQPVNSSTEHHANEIDELFLSVDEVFNGFDIIKKIKPKCKVEGIFHIGYLVECQYYIRCVKTREGLNSHIRRCHVGKFFDPKVRMCTRYYKCPKPPTTKAIETTTDNKLFSLNSKLFTEKNYDKTKKNTKKTPDEYNSNTTSTNNFTVECMVTPAPTLSPTKQKTWKPGSMNLTSSQYQPPDSPYLTTSAINTDPEKDSNPNNPPFDCILADKIVPKCKADGIYPVIYSNCKNYVVCKFSLIHVGWLSREFQCSANLLFDPAEGKCSSTYICRESRPCRDAMQSYRRLQDPKKFKHSRCNKEKRRPECDDHKTNRKYKNKRTECEELFGRDSYGR